MLFTPFTFIYFKCYGVREKNQGKNPTAELRSGAKVVTRVNNGCVNAFP